MPLGLNPMGYGMAAPPSREHGQTENIKKFFLRPLATTEDIWCQLFSEPGRVPTWQVWPLRRCKTVPAPGIG